VNFPKRLLKQNYTISVARRTDYSGKRDDFPGIVITYTYKIFINLKELILATVLLPASVTVYGQRNSISDPVDVQIYII
jgi:hypothetical protein